MADEVLPKKENTNHRTKNKNQQSYRTKPKCPWFDIECIKSKRELKRLAKSYGRLSTNDDLRESYNRHKKDYRKLIKSKKKSFFINLCFEIEDDREIYWNKFKKLKGSYKKSSNLDAFAFTNFCKFFNELYSNKSLTVSRTTALRANMPKTSLMVELTNILDEDITFNELKECVCNSKKGKAVAEDLISYDFLKTSNSKMLQTVLHMFNHCLSHGVYPWRTSWVTPLHKKGDIYNPINYRAIAVASNLGKLFSSILLQRLISFRQMTNPDIPNQLGFC